MAGIVSELKASFMAEKSGEQEQRSGSEVSRLEPLYRRYAGYIYTLCLRLLKDVRAAEDATVGAFVRLSRELMRRCKDTETFERLRELAITDALARLARFNRRRNTQVAGATLTRKPNVREEAPLDRAQLEALMARLPDDLRVAFVLHEMEGLSTDAIASHLQVEEAEAHQLVQLARLRLLQLQREETEGTD